MPKILSSNPIKIDYIESLIRFGKMKEARGLLLQMTKLRKLQTSEKDLEKIANFYRRTQLPHLAINILNPSIKAYREQKSKSLSPRLWAEYAMALHRIGNSIEAKLILQESTAFSHHYSQFYLGLIFLSEWEYEKAKSYFIEYLKNNQLDVYERCLGELNLLATHIFLHQNMDSFEEDLVALISKLEKWEFILLASNAKELLIQYYASLEENDIKLVNKNHQGDQKLNKVLLNENKLLNNLHSTMYSLYLEKWICVNLIKKNPTKALKGFISLKAKARSFSSWEVLRDCEFYIAKIQNSQDLFNKLYYGTPYLGYRRYILNRQKTFKPDDFFIWSELRINHKKSSILDLSSFSLNNLRKPLAMVGGASHRTLLSLLSDLFRPQTVGSIFSKVYPGEYYDQASSGLRVRQCIFRLQQNLEQHHLKLNIIYNKGYFIEFLDAVGIRFSSNLNLTVSETINKEEILLLQISKRFNDNPFSASQLAEYLRKSHATVVRLLNKLIQSQDVVSLGQGASRKYSIK